MLRSMKLYSLLSETIKITDNGLKSDCTFRENEGTITFNSLNYVPQGGIIVYRNAAGDV